MENTKTEWEEEFYKTEMHMIIPSIKEWKVLQDGTLDCVIKVDTDKLVAFISSTIKARERDVIKDILSLDQMALSSPDEWFVEVDRIQEYARSKGIEL